jgi:hypothetical protein
VVLNLAVWFGLHTFLPNGTLDVFAVVVASAAFAGLQWFKVSVVWAVLVCGALGLAWKAYHGF